MRAPLRHQCGLTMALLRYVQHKNAIPRWKQLPLHLAMEKSWLVSTAYFCLGLLCSGVGQTPDNNEGITKFQLYGGDMLLTAAQWREIEAAANPHDPHRPKRAVVNSDEGKWPDAVVPYEIDSSLSVQAKTAIADAIEEFKNHTCVNFRLRHFLDRDYVLFYSGDGCFSNIGRTGGKQNISIGEGCESKGVVMHELFHALGRWHEQSRPDRDLFVTVHKENIKSGFESNFERENTGHSTTQGIPYDYDSIMHYEAYAFSRDITQPTIEPVNRSISLSRLGQRRGFSELDLHHVNVLYCGAVIGYWSEWGTWSECSASCNGGTQTRTRNCAPINANCSGSNIQRRSCNESPCPLPATWGLWSAWSRCSSSCGGGRRTRLRPCLNGNTCAGESQQFERCNTQPCPPPMGWSEWGSWDECSRSCRGGTRFRWRHCIGSGCSGSNRQLGRCNTNITCGIPPSVGAWSKCSQTCGGGVQFRRVADKMENRSCNNQECHKEPCLRGLVHLGCYRLPNLTIQLFENAAELLSEDPSTRRDPVRRCGRVARRGGHTHFALALGMCYSGSDNLADYIVAGESEACDKGRGNLLNGYFSIDVYNITDSTSFQESVSTSEACGPNFCISDDMFCSGVLHFTSSRLLTVVLVVVVVLCRTVLL